MHSKAEAASLKPYELGTVFVLHLLPPQPLRLLSIGCSFSPSGDLNLFPVGRYVHVGYIRTMAHQFTSIGYVVERLQECEHFLFRIVNATATEFRFELNAFLSSTRSVTFVLQKCQSHVPQFDAWYDIQREQMKYDHAMRFFLELRNISQKHGPVSIVAGGRQNGGWSYRFIGIPNSVPSTLIGREIADCCAEHLQKLATLVFDYYREFPYQACIAKALTPKGMAALGYEYSDVEACFGFPPGWTKVVEDQIPAEELLRIWRREVDPVDEDLLERLARGRFERNGKPLPILIGSGGDLLDEFARLIDLDADAALNPRVVFLRAIGKRINDLESKQNSPSPGPDG